MGLIVYEGQQYRTVFGSDVSDGCDDVYLELQEIRGEGLLFGSDRRFVMEARWSDTNNHFTVSMDAGGLPFAVLEAFVQEARDRLPADKRFFPEPSDDET